MNNDPWQFVERCIVRKVGQAFICEARGGAGFFEHGDMCADPVAAMDSAARALDAEIRPKMERQAPRRLFGDLL